MVDNIKFSIDIDFIWINYFRLFDNEQIIILASNHQIYKMYLLNYSNKIISGNEICFVANLYMNKSNVMNPLVEYEKTEDSIYKKLFILYNLKWRNNLYKVIKYYGKKFNESGSLYLYLESILQKGNKYATEYSQIKKVS